MEGDGLAALVHAWLAAAVALIAGALVAVGLLDAARIVAARLLLDRLLLALIAAVIATALLGPVAAVADRPPAEALHLVYALVALGAAPLARLEAARRGSARTGAWVALGALVTLGAILRLWDTGG